MMKRITSLVFSIVLCALICIAPMSVSARASQTTFSLSGTQGGAGSTIDVAVSLSADSYFTNATIYLHYDPSIVQFVSESTGSISAGSSMFLVEDSPNEKCVKGAYVAVKPIKKAGDLLHYEFKVLKEAETTFTLSFKECIGEDENGEMFDVVYSCTSFVLNKGKGTPAATTKQPTTPRTTKATNPDTARTTTTRSGDKVTIPPANTTTGGKVVISTTAPQATTTVTYPTDTHGITLAPNVVTEADGNAATEANGAVVTAYTTTTPTASADVNDDPMSPTHAITPDDQLVDENGEPIEQSGQMELPDEEEGGRTWIFIVIGVVLVIGGGATVLLLIAKKKRPQPPTSES